ncbi:unnamed protein product [Adineta ricciae]|uniref:Beta-lactamase-related domain-containing protein n=1 Tax=Adineta ricciae TaxID=249248 RepID=A0A814HE85_ADIRI|nr:unnamed protein product [Adineta ricciae]CAF1304464.1 unnamed protein product [Adineta ricciae]
MPILSKSKNNICGYVDDNWQSIQAAFEQNFIDELDIGASLSIYHHGKCVVDLYGGWIDFEKKAQPYIYDTLQLVFSTSKGILSAAVALCVERGWLEYDAAIAKYWPEFGANGKEMITIGDLLAHRAGLPYINRSVTTDEACDWSKMISLLINEKPHWIPGSTHGYHGHTTGYIAGELIHRVDPQHRSFGQFVREEIDSEYYVGLTDETIEQRVAPLYEIPTQTKETDSQAEQTLTCSGALPLNQPTMIYNKARIHRAQLPAVNGITNARSLARIYSRLIGDVHENGTVTKRLLNEKTLSQAIQNVTPNGELDQALYGIPTDFSKGGFQIYGDAFQIFGDSVFGHTGYGGSCAFAYPPNELAHLSQPGHKSTSTVAISHTSSSSSNVRTHDFRLYPESRAAHEYNAIQIDNIASSMFHAPKTLQEIDSSKLLAYSESTFRSASFPIIWLDSKGDVHWNYAAQYETLNYLLEKQFPQEKLSTCLSRQLFILEQWSMGFFSRHHCFIEHFGQTLYSPSMTLLLPRRFATSNAAPEDITKEGTVRHFQSISLCSSHITHPDLKVLHDQLRSTGSGSSAIKVINHVHELLERDETKIRFKYSREIWKFGYDHVPHRRWLFDRDRNETKKSLTYHSPIPLLINHSNEHIYYDQSPSFDPSKWIPRNVPQASPIDVLPGSSKIMTVQDKIFTSFLRYMFLLFFSPLAPRIQTSAKLLAHYWSEHLSSKYHQPYKEALSKMAVMFIRRGDKMPEDSFWQKHKQWRNISMYVKGIVNEEERRHMKYTTIFVMTDDPSVMSSIINYAQTGLRTSQKDEPYAREHLHGRDILYNVFAPQSCVDPLVRVGFDQFLADVQFVTEHASLVVGHTDSNVGRYLEEIIYVNRQHNPNVQTLTHVINAPDTLE